MLVWSLLLARLCITGITYQGCCGRGLSWNRHRWGCIVHRLPSIALYCSQRTIRESIRCYRRFFWWSRSWRRGIRRSSVWLVMNRSWGEEVRSTGRGRLGWWGRGRRGLPGFRSCWGIWGFSGRRWPSAWVAALHRRSWRRRRGSRREPWSRGTYTQILGEYQNSKSYDSTLDYNQVFYWRSSWWYL